jgi:hypothetical protein
MYFGEATFELVPFDGLLGGHLTAKSPLGTGISPELYAIQVEESPRDGRGQVLRGTAYTGVNLIGESSAWYTDEVAEEIFMALEHAAALDEP